MWRKLKQSKLVTKLFALSLLVTLAVPIAMNALVLNRTEAYRVLADNTDKEYISAAVKKFDDGQYAYCLEYGKQAPETGSDLQPGEVIKDPQIWKTLKYGYPNQKWYNTGNAEQDEKLNFYVTQLTLWYFVEDWPMEKIDRLVQANGNKKYKAIKTDVAKMKQNIKGLIKQVEEDKSNVEPSLSFSETNINLNDISGEFAKTPLITLNGNNIKGTSTIVLEGAPEGTYVEKENGEKSDKVNVGEKFRVVIPTKSDKATITYKTTGEGQTLRAVNYPSEEKQDVVKYDEVGVKLETATEGRINWGPNPVRASISIRKVNSETGEGLPGATFKLAQNGQVVHEVTSGSDGLAIIKDIANGTYQLQEIKAPDGFIIDSKVKEITVTQADNGKTFDIEAPNAPIKGEVELIKRDAEETEKVLEGVKFELYKKNTGSENPSNPETGGGSSDNGEAAQQPQPVNNNQQGEEQKPGEEEQQGEEQKPGEEEQQGEEQKPSEEGQSAEEQKPGEETQENAQDKEPTDSAYSENLLPEGEDKTSEDGSKLIGLYATNAEGKIKVKDLQYGNYYFKEVETKEGYVLSDEPIPFEITDNGKMVELTADNKKIEGELEITKVDVSTGELLPNARFAIYDESGENVVVKGVTDENGIARFKLGYGKYFYQEIAAPDGYQLDDKKYPFEIKEDGEIVKCQMTNTKIPQETSIPKTGTIPTNALIMGVPIGIVALSSLYAIFKKND